MIIAVKRTSKKRLIIKIISVIVLIGMFYAYYLHMSEEFAKQEKQKELQKIEDNRVMQEKRRKKEVENLIYREVESAVDLIGQEYIRNVRIVSKKVLIVCDPNTNIDALVVRYGSMALVKKTIDDIKIAIDLEYIVESKLNDKK